MEAITLLTDGEAAAMIRMLPSRLNRLVKAGEVPFVRLPDGEIRFDPADLRDWINEHKHGSQSGVAK